MFFFLNSLFTYYILVVFTIAVIKQNDQIDLGWEEKDYSYYIL